MLHHISSMSFSSKKLQYCFLQDGAGRNESESDLSVDEYSHEENNVSDSSAEINFSEESESDSDSFIECSEDAAIDSAVSQGDPLFQHSPVTVEEAVISLCDVFVKNRLTKTALSDMLKFCKYILPKDSSMPSNLCEFFNFVKGHSPPVQEVLHLYCPGCFAHKVKKDDDCVTEGCSVKDGFFFVNSP